MPLVPMENLIIAAVPPREDPRDALISRSALVDWRVGDSAALAGTQQACGGRWPLLLHRPDVRVEPSCGETSTRSAAVFMKGKPMESFLRWRG